jgi:hypothetical protein
MGVAIHEHDGYSKGLIILNYIVIVIVANAALNHLNRNTSAGGAD